MELTPCVKSAGIVPSASGGWESANTAPTTHGPTIQSRPAFRAHRVQWGKGTYLRAPMAWTRSVWSAARASTAKGVLEFAKLARRMRFRTRPSQPVFLANHVPQVKESAQCVAGPRTRFALHARQVSLALVARMFVRHARQVITAPLEHRHRDRALKEVTAAKLFLGQMAKLFGGQLKTSVILVSIAHLGRSWLSLVPWGRHARCQRPRSS